MASDRFNLDDYIPVSERLQKFRTDHEGWSLTSELIVDDGRRVVMRAQVVDDNGVLRAVGHAEEVRDQGPVNKTSAVENAETSAWGRALACLGIHVSRQIASRDEIQQARERAERRNDEPTAAQKARAEFGDRVRGSVVRAAFKTWASGQGLPDVPARFTDDQLAKSVEWLDFAESAYEHDHETAGEAPQAPVQPSEGVDAPIPAPEPSKPSEQDPRVAAAATFVKGLDQVAMLVEFTKRNLRAPRPVGEQRIALAAALVDDESWSPPVTEGALPL